MPAVATKLLTAEEFFLLPDPPNGAQEELVRGKVITMPGPGFEHGDIQIQIAFLLKLYLRQNPVGRCVAESGVVTEHGPDTVRGPDISFWSFKRLPKKLRPVAYPDVVADLCVEVRSPSNSMKKLRLKAAEYLNAGVRMVWIVDPKEQSVTVYREPGRGSVISDGQTISGEDVLPGFECNVAEFFE